MKILVTYDSKHGATGDIAQTIADKLRERDLTVDCCPISSVKSLRGYDAAVVGSAVYFGRWRHDAMSFVRRHAADLAQMPLWTFSSGPVGPNPPPASKSEPRGEVALAEVLGARGHVVFGGSVDARTHGMLERKLVERTPRGYRDNRDWGEIRAWAAKVADELEREPSHPPAI